MGAIRDASEASKRELLEAQRAYLADLLDSSPPAHTVAGLMKQLREVREELEALNSADGGDEIGKAASVPDAEFDPATL